MKRDKFKVFRQLMSNVMLLCGMDVYEGVRLRVQVDGKSSILPHHVGSYCEQCHLFVL